MPSSQSSSWKSLNRSGSVSMLSSADPSTRSFTSPRPSSRLVRFFSAGSANRALRRIRSRSPSRSSHCPPTDRRPRVTAASSSTSAEPKILSTVCAVLVTTPCTVRWVRSSSGSAWVDSAAVTGAASKLSCGNASPASVAGSTTACCPASTGSCSSGAVAQAVGSIAITSRNLRPVITVRNPACDR